LLRKIGVTSIWPTPVIHTYKDGFEASDIVDISAVDPRYGTEDDFVAMVELAHKKEMKVVIDLPLSVSLHHKWNSEKKFDGYVEQQTDSEEFVRINLLNSKAREAVVEAAVKFAIFGVDGFHINDSLLGGATNISAYIRNRLIETEQTMGKEVIFFASPSLKGVSHSVNDGISYTIRSISDVNGGLCDSADSAIKCVRAALKEATEAAKSVPFIWKNGDVNSARADRRFGQNASEIQTLLTMIQMTLPGPVQSYYGEELALGSNVKNVSQSRGVMQWDDHDNAGFSSIKDPLYFETTADFKTVNYKNYYEQSRSPLRVYQKLAKLRGRTEVIQSGDITITNEGDIIVISRYVMESSDPVFLLAVNLPVEGNGSVQKLTVSAALVPGRPLESAEVVIASPNNVMQTHTRVSLQEGLSLGPFEGVLLKF